VSKSIREGYVAEQWALSQTLDFPVCYIVVLKNFHLELGKMEITREGVKHQKSRERERNPLCWRGGGGYKLPGTSKPSICLPKPETVWGF